MYRRDSDNNRLIRYFQRITEKLHDEIKAKDERISELELHLDKKVQNPNPEPFTFTKDTPCRIEDGEVELFWEDATYIYGRSRNEGCPWYEGRWFKSGKSGNSRFNLIPILPEEKVMVRFVNVYPNCLGAGRSKLDDCKRVAGNTGGMVGIIKTTAKIVDGKLVSVKSEIVE